MQSNRPAAGAKPLKREAKKKVAPKFIEPMQCKAVPALPKEGDWTFEITIGYRCLAVKDDGEVKLFSRNENVLNAGFPSIVGAFAALPEASPSTARSWRSTKRDAPHFNSFRTIRRGGLRFISMPSIS